MAIDHIGFSYNDQMITQNEFIELMEFWKISPDDIIQCPNIHDRSIVEFQLTGGIRVRVFESRNSLSKVYQGKFEYNHLFPVMHSVMCTFNGEYIQHSLLKLGMRSRFYQNYKIID
jgi:hypothetical protein